jgi:hypothetical protein
MSGQNPTGQDTTGQNPNGLGQYSLAAYDPKEDPYAKKLYGQPPEQPSHGQAPRGQNQGVSAPAQRYDSSKMMAALGAVKPGNYNEQAGDLTDTPYATADRRVAQPEGGKNVWRGAKGKQTGPTNAENLGVPQPRKVNHNLQDIRDNMPDPNKKL